MRFQVSADVVRVSQERMLEGRLRLFQIAEAAERKPRAPNEMLQRVTERRLAEADHRALHEICHWTRLAYVGVDGIDNRINL